MKKYLPLSSFLFLILILLNYSVVGQGTPEILYYKFNDNTKSVRNLASAPPSGTSTGSVNGALTVGGTIGACGSRALEGSGGTSNTDFFDTKWATSTSGSWTISFVTNNIQSTTTLYYLWSDISAGSLRCFTGGVAGAGNWIIRGGFTDVLITGGASTSMAVNTFVYDASANNIYAYLNGTLVTTVAQSTITFGSSGSLILSGYNSLNGLTAGGTLDEFRFYSRALSAADVKKLSYTGSTYGSITQSALCSFTGPSGLHTWNRTGKYTDTLLNYNNCDSIITVNLTITGNTSSTQTISSCDFYASPSKKFFWTKSGTYTDIIKNKAGCDSIMTFRLTILNSTNKTIAIKTCGSYTSPSGKYNWTTSGKYLDTIPNKKGCDSIITINLNLGKANSFNLTLKECNSYKSPSGKFTWSKSGSYKDTLINVSGCDSLLTINLTIITSTTSAINVKACDKYKSPSGKTDWATSGTYLDTILNNKGCDSLITVNLTLNKTTYKQISPQSCGTYTSPSGKYSSSVSNSFFDTIPNKAGCDSVLLIDLIINKNTSTTISRTVCNRFVSPSGNKIWTTSGKYYDTIGNKKGCDSAITINLTINAVNVSVSQKNPNLTALLSGATYQWLNCNANYSKISGATNQVYKATAVGKYAVEITYVSCIDTSVCLNVTSLQIDKNSLGNYLSVYPNPGSGQFTISSGKPLNNATLKIINTLGETVVQQNNVDGSILNLDISGHVNGIYFIEITEKENSGRVKLVKY